MSVDYTAVIARGFLIDKCPYGNLPDEFIDEWVIDFDCYYEHSGYLVGYYIKSICPLGVPYEIGHTQGDPLRDMLLTEACNNINLPIGEIKTYFGVRVS